MAEPSVLVIARSAEALTVVVAVALLLAELPSAVADVIVAVLERTVPFDTDGETATVSVKIALPAANEALEQVTVPPAPIAGVVQDQPPAADNETKVVPVGSVSLQLALAAVSGPLLVAVIV